AALVLVSPAFAAGFSGGWAAARAWLTLRQRAITVIALGAVGTLQSLSFIQVATDDLIRYWSVADAWAAGFPFAVAEGAPGSGEFYLVDLPVYPALIALSFAAVGHRYLALHVPLLVANVVLPFALYGAARSTDAARPSALALSLAVLCFPAYQVYALGSAEPDPVWAPILAIFALLAIRCSQAGHVSWRWWVALGAVAGILVLTRPEGPLYAAPLFLGLLWQRRGQMVKPVIAAVVAVLPVVLFSMFLLWAYGIPWPAGWGSVASPRYIQPNLRLIVLQDLPHYAASAGLPAPHVLGPVFTVILAAWVLTGSVLLWRRFPGLRLFPLPVALNLAVILMSPTDLAADHLSPPTVFRHFAIAIPWLVPALAVVLSITPSRSSWMPTLALGIIAVGGLATLGASAGRIGSGELAVLTSDPYVLLSDLGQADDLLPVLPLVLGPGRGASIDTRFPYMEFRGRLFAAMQPYDLHLNDHGRAYTLAAGILTIVLLVAATLASPVRRKPPVTVLYE
ncbi:MAG TPA: glycosyltransferase family 39 protein, partial [Chloroflexota bacterium]|nr:glycosyltransferase family 39 protein [Chloroflexota bacterium]